MDRVKIKSAAREMVKTNKWNIWKPTLVVAAISMVVALVVSMVGSNTLLGSLIDLVFSILLVPVSVGLSAYYLKLVRKEEFSLNQLTEYYPIIWKILLIDLLTCLFVFLWSLLFIIPGIIAAISYAMVSFVVVDNQELSAKETLDKSKELMNGHKWDYVIFQLSFIGWDILAALTLGLLYIWLLPYQVIASTMYYEELTKLK